MGTGLVRVSYLCTVGEVWAAACEMSVGSVGSVEVGDTGGNPMTWPGEGGLARCREGIIRRGGVLYLKRMGDAKRLGRWGIVEQ